MSRIQELETRSIQAVIADSEVAFPTGNKRAFEYNMNDKTAKAKLVKNSKRKPLEIISNSTSTNFVFSVGAWNHVVLPSIKYWNSIMGDKTCKADPIIVKVASVVSGEDTGKNHIDTLIVFYSNRDKVVCHLYNTCMLIHFCI